MLSNWPGTHSWETKPGPELPRPTCVCLSLLPLGLEPLTAGLGGGSGCWLSVLRAQCSWDVATWVSEGPWGPDTCPSPLSSPQAFYYDLDKVSETLHAVSPVGARGADSSLRPTEGPLSPPPAFVKWGNGFSHEPSSRMGRGWPGLEPGSVLGAGPGGGQGLGAGEGVAQAAVKVPSLFLGEANALCGKAHPEDGVSHQQGQPPGRHGAGLGLAGQGEAEEDQELHRLGPQAGGSGVAGPPGLWGLEGKISCCLLQG